MPLLGLFGWIIVALVIGGAEWISDTHKANEFKKKGGMAGLYPHTFGKKDNTYKKK